MDKLVSSYWYVVCLATGMPGAFWHGLMLLQMWHDKPYQDALNTGAIWMAAFLISMGNYLESRKNGK